MAFHIVSPRRLRLAEQSKLAREGKSPRHALALIAEELNATVHEPTGQSVTSSVRSAILPTPDVWALAEAVATNVAQPDTVFCSSEAGGLQLAAIYKDRLRRPRLALFAHNLDRPRAKFALKWWKMDRTVDLFLACSEYQIDFLKKYLHLSNDRVQFIWDHTDNQFFTPGAAANKSRPLVVSVGLEQRDYATLALATSDLDVDVKISGFSQDAQKGTFPDQMPPNMDRRFYNWPDLRQLYRDADVVVVSCRENKYAAGVQSLMEASSCRRPIIATATMGLRKYINDAIVAVRPGKAGEMHDAIKSLIRDRVAAEVNASMAYGISHSLFAMNRYVDEICQRLRSL